MHFRSKPSRSGATGSSFGLKAAAPPLIPGQGAPPCAALHSATPGSPALSRSEAESQAMAPGSPQFCSLSPGPLSIHGSPSRGPDISLSNVHVAPEAIKPSENIRGREMDLIKYPEHHFITDSLLILCLPFFLS